MSRMTLTAPKPSLAGRVLVALAALALLATALVSTAPPAKANGGYPWADATTLNAATYDWGYATCPSNAPGCKAQTYPKNGILYGQYDPWNYYFRNCTSYIAWKLSSLGVPANKFQGLGSAKYWTGAADRGIAVNTTPAAGSVAINTTVAGYGHVAYVESVNGGNITVSEYNWSPAGTYGTRTVAASSFHYFAHYEALTGAPGGGGGNPPAQVTSSTGDAQAAGDFNGDAWGDVAILHKRTDGGADVHILYGNIPGYTFGNSSTFIRSLSAADGWDWSKIKVVAGKFNGDNSADLVILHQRPDGGADVHMLQGGIGASMFANSSTWVRSLAGSSGWDWSKMQVVSGDANGDAWDDIVILHQRPDGGADVHILYGNIPGYTFGNTSTWLRSLVGADGWDWSKMKLTLGMFNGDTMADLAIMHQSTDGGIGVHLLRGGAAPFSNTSTWLRTLSGGDGWNWTSTKLAAGDFNGDAWDDIVILHQRPDGGADVHILYGNIPGYTFGNTSTWLRSLVGADGWDWSKMKLTAGYVNGDHYADIAVLHASSAGGIDVHGLFGGSAVLMNGSTFVSSLQAPSWSWTLVQIA